MDDLFDDFDFGLDFGFDIEEKKKRPLVLSDNEYVFETDSGFDIDVIEDDWKRNGKRLSDEEILEIYKSEGVTRVCYYKELDAFRARKPKSKFSPEERLFAAIFDRDGISKEIEKEKIKVEEWYRQYSEIKPKQLSDASCKIVVEGCMDLVFEMTRRYHELFKKDNVSIAELIYYNARDEEVADVSMEEIMKRNNNTPMKELYNVPMEILYYCCLESLIKSVKHCLHYHTKACFRSYAYVGMYRQIVKLISRRGHTSYRNAKCIIDGLMYGENYFKNHHEDYVQPLDFKRQHLIMELEKRESIYHRLEYLGYDVDYIRIITSIYDEFLVDYSDSLDELSPIEEYVMRHLYDVFNDEFVTVGDIAKKFDIKPSKINKIKNKAILKLRDNPKIIKYKDSRIL